MTLDDVMREFSIPLEEQMKKKIAKMKKDGEDSKAAILGDLASATMGISMNAPNLYGQTNLPGAGFARGIADTANKFSESNPKEAFAANVGGGLLNPLSRVFSGANAGQTGAKMLGNAALGAGIMGGASAGNAGKYNEDSAWGNIKKYLGNATLGAGEGLVVTGALLGVGQAAKAGLDALSPSAVKAFKYLEKEYGPSLTRFKDNLTYAPRTAEILKNVTASQPEIRQTINERAQAIVSGSNNKVENILGAKGLKESFYLDKLNKKGARADEATAAYKAAEKTRVPTDAALFEILDPNNSNTVDILKTAIKKVRGEVNTEKSQRVIAELESLKNGGVSAPVKSKILGGNGEPITTQGSPPTSVSADALLEISKASSEVYNTTLRTAGLGKEPTIYTPQVAQLNEKLSGWIKNQSPEIKKAYGLTEKNSAEQAITKDAREVFFKGDSNVAQDFVKNMQTKYAGVLTPAEVQDLTKAGVGKELKELTNSARSKEGGVNKKALDALIDRQEGMKSLLGQKNYDGLLKELNQEGRDLSAQTAIANSTKFSRPPEPINLENAASSGALGLLRTAGGEIAKQGRKAIGALGMPKDRVQQITNAITTSGGAQSLQNAAGAAQNSVSRAADRIGQGYQSGAAQRGAMQLGGAITNAGQPVAPQQMTPETGMTGGQSDIDAEGWTGATYRQQPKAQPMQPSIAAKNTGQSNPAKDTIATDGYVPRTGKATIGKTDMPMVDTEDGWK